MVLENGHLYTWQYNYLYVLFLFKIFKIFLPRFLPWEYIIQYKASWLLLFVESNLQKGVFVLNP